MKSSIQYQLEYAIKKLEGVETQANNWAEEEIKKGVLSPGNNYPFKYGVMRGTVLEVLGPLKDALESVRKQDDN
jgi:hypothetical protein